MAVRKNLSLMGTAHLVSFLLNFGSVMIISRLLSPEEIGIYSVSVAVLGIAHIFRDFGVGQYLVQAKEVGRNERRAAFSVTLYSSWMLALLLFLVRHPMATFYENVAIAQVLEILCLNFLILPFGAPLLALMQRDLQFNKLATNMILSTVVQTGTTVALAYNGFSYLSMAWGALASHIGAVVWLNVMRPGEMFQWPTIKGLGETVRFGSIASLASIIKEIGTGAPDLILGRTLGFAEVAIFSRANSLKKLLLARIIAMIRGVYFPTLASELRKGGDGAILYSQAMNYMVAILAPLLAMLAILSEPLILFLFGDQWYRAAPLASLICLYAMIMTPYSLSALTLIAAGRVSLNLKLQIVVQSVQIAVLLSSIWYPLEYVVVLFSIVTLVEIISVQVALRKTFGLRFVDHFRYIGKSIRLVPYAAIGPLTVVFCADRLGMQSSYLSILLAGGVLSGLGWLIGVFLLKHAVQNEMSKVLNALTSKLSVFNSLKQ